MKKQIINIALVVLCIWSINLKAQNLLPAEKATLWTDRAIFISGESISFAGIIQIDKEPELLSSAVYIELISPENQKINQIKLPLEKSFFEGQIDIPMDVLSGYYYLRAYTKWMRNGSPEDYEYLLMKIINPFENEILDINDSLLLEDPIPQISSDAEATKLNKTIGQNITIDPGLIPENLKHGSISLIPKGSQSFIQHFQKSKASNYNHIQYYPETRGLSISGEIFVKDSLSPYHKMNVHLLGEKDFTVVLCDSFGKFNVALPDAYLEHELFLIAASSNKGKVKILIDQDFCTKEINIPCPEFSLEEAEQEELLKMAKNQQIKSIYVEDKKEEMTSDEKIPFYGSVFKSLVLDFYVPLDSMEQYFTDIPSWVMVKKKKKKRYLQLIGEQTELVLYPSLLLVDWVPVDEADRVLAMNPRLVKQIDIINQGYMHGNEIYGGIIHVITHKGDFGNLKFPETGQYLNYKFYSANLYEQDQSFVFDNTYFWKTIPANNAELEIQTPLLPGDYILLIQGVDEEGELIQKVQNIEVIK